MIIRFCVCIACNSYIIQQSVKCLEQTLQTQIKHIPNVQETFAFSLTDVRTVGQKCVIVRILFFSAYVFCTILLELTWL